MSQSLTGAKTELCAVGTEGRLPRPALGWNEHIGKELLQKVTAELSSQEGWEPWGARK